AQALHRVRQRHQVASQIATVDGGHVARQERLAGARVVPVEEMPPEALQVAERLQAVLESSDPLCYAEPAKLVRRRRAEQIHADVGRRGALRQYRDRRLLEVIRRQVMVRRRDKLLEVGPGPPRDQAQGPLFISLQCGLRRLRLRGADEARYERGTEPQ